METENNEKKPMIRRGSFRVGYGSEEKLIIMCGIGAALCLCMFIVGLVLFGAPTDFMGFMSSVFWIIPMVICLVFIPVIIYVRRSRRAAATTCITAISPR